MKRGRSWVVFVCLSLLLPACSLWADSPTNGSYSRELTGDTEFSTESGSFFTVPGGWYMTYTNGMHILQDPDKQLTLVLMESHEVDGLDAIKAAWARYQPDFSRLLFDVDHPKDPEHWDEIIKGIYQTKPEENLILQAGGRKKGHIWYVWLYQANKAVTDRRQAQLDTIMDSWRPRVVTFSDKPFSGKLRREFDAKMLKDFEDFIEHGRQRSKIPGLAFAVVQDGKIIDEKGLGVLEKGKKDPVTPQTLFSIGSISKSLTTLMMAELVDHNKLTWDTPATQLLPGFQVANDNLMRNLTLKYTVCACTGLPRQDMEMLFSAPDTTPEQVIEKMRVMVPTTGFGETFQYSNIMVAAGGYMAGHAAYPQLSLGEAYDQAMQTYVFTPLGMRDTTTHTAVAIQRPHASPHGGTLKLDYDPIAITYNDWLEPYRPAAGIWSSAENMAVYVLLELAKGVRYDGVRLVSEENLGKRYLSEAKISGSESYGLGLMLGDEDGLKTAGHGGNTQGYTADVFFLPGQGVGYVLLTNADHCNYFTEFVRERFLEMLTKDTNNVPGQFDEAMNKRERANREDLKWVDQGTAQTWISDFVGDYQNELLGKISLRYGMDGATFETPTWKSAIARILDRQDKFWCILSDPPYTFTDFTLDDVDGKKTLTLKMPQQTYVFKPVKTVSNR